MKETQPLSYLQLQVIEKNDYRLSTPCDDPKNQGDIEESKMKIECIKRHKIATSLNNLKPFRFQQRIIEENYFCDSTSYDELSSLTKSSYKFLAEICASGSESNSKGYSKVKEK